jgi:hypothetical protein
VARLRLQKAASAGEILHALRLFGPGAAVFDPTLKREVALLDRLLDHDLGSAAFGEAPLIDTREGVRSRIVVPRNAKWQRERQAHEDQLLAVLAELGVPLSRPLTTASGARSVRDLFNDTCANFNPDQREVEWSAMAIALYLPPRTGWHDKFGRACSLDSLVELLLARPSSEALPCGGTHRLYTLTVLLRVDEATPVLSSGVREKLHDYLRAQAAVLVRTQAEDGSWLTNWYRGERARSSSPGAPAELEQARVLATGHHVEWVMLLPPEFQPPRDCLVRAARWLQLRLVTDAAETLLAHYCPYSHAGRVLSVLAGPPEPAPAGSRPAVR